jgi:hypothetical protein
MINVNCREQKLFIEASDWEAKFYQIQSKYLLLLNELHNPQVALVFKMAGRVGKRRFKGTVSRVGG